MAKSFACQEDPPARGTIACRSGHLGTKWTIGVADDQINGMSPFEQSPRQPQRVAFHTAAGEIS
jgi:hypothetical protein